jgi:nucleoside-diphosphate-sugar epimerase
VASTLVLGLSGQVGAALQERLPAGLGPLLAISRREQAPRPGVEWHRDDLEFTPEFPPGIERILSLGPLDVFASWLQRSGAQPARIVALGSTGVRHKQASPDPSDRDEAQRLGQAEAVLFECASQRGMACSVLRPSREYGPGRGARSRA